MKTFLLSIPEKIRLKGDSLDAEAILCGKAWNVFNDEGVKQKLIFRPKGKLLVTTAGKTQDASWEFVPEDRSIIIDDGEQRTNYMPAYYDDKILALQVDGRDESLFMIDSKKADSFKPKTLLELNDYLSQLANVSDPSVITSRSKTVEVPMDEERNKIESEEESRAKAEAEALKQKQEELDKAKAEKKLRLKERFKDEILQEIESSRKEKRKGQIVISIVLGGIGLSFIILGSLDIIESSIIVILLVLVFMFGVPFIFLFYDNEQICWEAEKTVIHRHWNEPEPKEEKDEDYMPKDKDSLQVSE